MNIILKMFPHIAYVPKFIDEISFVKTHQQATVIVLWVVGIRIPKSY